MNISTIQEKRWWGTWNSPRLSLKFAERILSSAAELELAIIKGSTLPIDKLLKNYFRRNKKMGSKDRALLSEALYGLVRNSNRIQAAMEGRPHTGGELLEVALWDRMDIAMREENRAYLPKWLGEVEAKLLELRSNALRILSGAGEMSTAELDDEVGACLSLLFNVPQFWLALGPWATLAEAVAELSVAKAEQNLHLRVNLKKARREEVLAALAKTGVIARPTTRSPMGIIVEKRLNLQTLQLWKSGEVEVQDEGSQLVTLACGAIDEGQRVLDYCAGAGGKSLGLAALGASSIACYDVEPKRLARARERFLRAGVKGVEFWTSKRDEEEGSFDLVVVDAPCSSTGTLRRSPEIVDKWSKDEISGFAKVQGEVLSEASKYVREGGRLVYITCSLFPRENEGVVAKFLGCNDEFSLVPIVAEVFEGLPGADNGQCRVSLSLENYAGDGFFVATMVRRKGQ